MSVDISQIHGILKDKTRAHILELLAQKGSASYGEFMSLLEMTHTGNLNYHLKVLGDLLQKGEDGSYSLSEKGKVAFELLGKFQTAAGVNGRMKTAGLRGMYIAAGVTLPIIAVLTYLLNPSLVAVPIFVLVAVYGYFLLIFSYGRWKRYFETGKPPGSVRTRRIAMIYLFALLFFFVNVGCLGFAEFFYPVINTYPPYFLTIVGAGPGIVIGAFVGDLIGRRRNYEPITWPL